MKKKSNSSSVNNNGPISPLNNFSKVSVLVIHAHTPRYFKHKWNPSQHGFSEANLQVLIWYPICISFTLQLVLNVKFILFILTFAAHLTFSRILLYFTNVVPMGLLTYEKWFLSCLTNGHDCTHFRPLFITFRSTLGGRAHKDLFQDLCFLTYLITTFLM